MERLSKQAPASKLTDDQRRELAELDSQGKAKLAEREIFLQGEMDKARAQGDYEALEQLDQQRLNERKVIQAELEEKKEAVRRRGKGQG